MSSFVSLITFVHLPFFRIEMSNIELTKAYDELLVDDGLFWSMNYFSSLTTTTVV
jgi:hypothetical protein